MSFNITPQAILSDISSAANFLISSLAVDVNAVLNQETLQQVFPDARPVKATVKETARVMDYPVETGATLSDHKIINPIEIEIIFVINQDFYSSAYQQIRTAWINSTLLSVQTRTGTYLNMIVSDMPHEEEPDMYNAITQQVRFREIIFVAPNSLAQPGQLANYKPANPTNLPVINRGLLAGLAAPTTVLSYFHAKSVWGL